MAETGLLYLLQIERDATPGTYDTIVCQDNTSFTMDQDAIDTSGKCGGADRTFLAGKKSWGFSADGAFVLADLGYLEAYDMWVDNEVRSVQVVRSDGAKWRGNAVVTKIQLDFPHDDKAKFSIELQGTGALSVI